MPLHLGEILATEDRLVWPSSWVTSFPLPHDNLGVGERVFSQVVTQHAISTFNTCSRGATHWSLSDTGGSDSLEGVVFPHTTPRPFQPMVLPFPPKGPAWSLV
jgi:hypothetical protein